MIGECHLCHLTKQLRQSHIIPKFAFRWLRSTSLGLIRDSRRPNLPIQDIEKIYLLCDDCEQLFNSWEMPFCESIFLPVHEGGSASIFYAYQDWALKFAVSVSWRILARGKLIEDLRHFSKEQHSLAEEALETWREFLLDGRGDPGRFEQHMVVLDLVTSHTTPELSPYINRYFLRTIDLDIACSETRAFVFAKMCRLLLFGLIQEEQPEYWQGTKLHAQQGLIGNEQYGLPLELCDYISSRSNKAARALASLSPTQKSKIEPLYQENPEAFIRAEAFRALCQDAELFGSDAFGITNSDSDDQNTS